MRSTLTLAGDRDNQRMIRIAKALAALICLAACTPALDWREVRLSGGQVTGLFPCKPSVQERSVKLGGWTWAASLHSCDAEGVTFAALQMTPVVDLPLARAEVQESLKALRESAAQRWGLSEDGQAAPASVKVPSALTPEWTRHRRSGQDQAPVATQALFFALHGQLFQLSMHGPNLRAEAIEEFFGRLQAKP